MEEKGKEELIRLCEDASIVHIIPAGEICRIEVCAWSAVICEIMLRGIRDGNADAPVNMNITEPCANASACVDASACVGVSEFQANSLGENRHMDLSDCCFAEMLSLEALSEGYRLKFYNLDLDKEQEIAFESISMRCEPCNAFCERIEDYTRLQTPWEYLGLVARGICCHIEYGVANEAELELHNLAEYLEVLQGSWEMVKTASTSQEPAEGQQLRVKGVPRVFFECAKECGASSVVEKYASDYSKLFRELSKAKYEPFWRKLYLLLAASQNGIPSHAERTCDAGDLQAYRELVAHQVRKEGFEGEYPYFYSDAAIQGPSLFFSYEKTHLAFHKNGARRFLLCREQDADGRIEMEFFCGIKFQPGKGDDVFSCMFDCEGQSYFSSFSTMLGDNNPCDAEKSNRTGIDDPHVMGVKNLSETQHNNGNLSDNRCNNEESFEIQYESGYSGLAHANQMKTAVCAAAKSSHLRRLNREEYSYKHTAAVWNSKGFYITYFLSCLVMFGALMTVGFMAIEAVLVFLFTQSAADVTDCFALTPWGLVFGAAGILYAVPMTICTYLAMRK